MVSSFWLQQALQIILSHRINLVTKFIRLSHLDGWISLDHKLHGEKIQMSVEILEMLANTCQTLKYVRFGCSLCSGCLPGIEHLWMMIERNDGLEYKGWRWATRDEILVDERMKYYVGEPGDKVRRHDVCSWQFPFHA